MSNIYSKFLAVLLYSCLYGCSLFNNPKTDSELLVGAWTFSEVESTIEIKTQFEEQIPDWTKRGVGGILISGQKIDTLNYLYTTASGQLIVSNCSPYSSLTPHTRRTLVLDSFAGYTYSIDTPGEERVEYHAYPLESWITYPDYRLQIDGVVIANTNGELLVSGELANQFVTIAPHTSYKMIYESRSVRGCILDLYDVEFYDDNTWDAHRDDSNISGNWYLADDKLLLVVQNPDEHANNTAYRYYYDVLENELRIFTTDTTDGNWWNDPKFVDYFQEGSLDYVVHSDSRIFLR